MQIISRFELNGNNAYTLDDDGLTYPVTERSLYDQDTLTSLIAAGYKVLDYHGNIITPDGINIKDMIASPCTVTDDEKQTMIDMEDLALSEAEASSYFSRDVALSVIETKTPKVQIHTREELIVYLNNQEKIMSIKGKAQDIRPLNSFVAKEALFTMEELVRDESVKRYFSIITRRRKMNSYQSLKNLIEFLQSEGVLGDTYDEHDIKQAYLSWGICGLNISITNMQVLYDQRTKIFNRTDVGENMREAGKVKIKAVLDRNGHIHYKGKDVNLIDAEDMSECEIFPIREEDFWKLYRSVSSWTSEYALLDCFTFKGRTRTFFSLMDDNGISYTAKVDDNLIAIHDMQGLIYSSTFLLMSSEDGVETSIGGSLTEDDYTKGFLIRSKVRSLVKSRTVDTPVNNSFDLIVNEGVTPENAINYIARQIQDRPDLNTYYQDGIDHCDAAAMYRHGPEAKLIRKYNPDGIEYNNMDELIEIMLETRDQMIENNEYLVVGKDDVGPEANATREELQVRPLEQLEFAKAVKEGNYAINELGAGIHADGNADILELSDFLETILILKAGTKKLSYESVANHLMNIEDQGLFDFEKVFRERSNAFRGYLKDRAELNAARATQSAASVYITKVFREAANVPVNQQRHYMFECISMDTFGKHSKMGTVRDNIAASICKKIDSMREIDYVYKDLLKTEAPATAVKLMFKILFKRTVPVIDGDTYTIREVITSGLNKYDINIPLHMSDYVAAASVSNYRVNRICTLYDWCTYEMTSFAWNLYCVNADITPWEVKPKKGFSIGCYNFVLNYMRKKSFEMLAPSFQEKVNACKAKVGEFGETFMSLYLLEGDFIDSTMKYTENTIDEVLNSVCEETVENYRDRFQMHNASASKAGKYLKRMRLKTDAIFGCYAEMFDPNPIGDDDIYEVMESPAQKNVWLTSYEPTVLSDKSSNQITTKGNIISKFSIAERPYAEVARWFDLVKGTRTVYGVSSIFGNNLMVVTPNGKKTFNLTTMTKDIADKLVAKGIFYQLGEREYLITTLSEEYSLEVM